MKLTNVLFNFVTIITVAFFILTLALKIGGVQVFAVATDSMLPYLRTGDAILVKPSGEYAEGDVITAYLDSGGTFTHRVTRIDGDLVYTKGDANPEEDRKPTDVSKVIGKVIFVVPSAGNIVLRFDGRTAAFILAAVLIAVEVIRFIIFKIQKTKQKEDTANEKT